jgi:hypothetical protein
MMAMIISQLLIALREKQSSLYWRTSSILFGRFQVLSAYQGNIPEAANHLNLLGNLPDAAHFHFNHRSLSEEFTMLSLRMFQAQS